MNNKFKVMFGSIFAVVIFLILIISATYAYFTANFSITGGNTKIDVTVENVGVSTLKSKNNLILNLSLVDMMKKDKDVAYYATLDGTPSINENSEIIGISEVQGNGIMKCNYTIEVDANGNKNMFDAFQNMENKSTNQLILNVDGNDYDLANMTFPYNITGLIDNVSESNPQNITASFKIINRYDIDQSVLEDKDITLSFNVIEYKCSIIG